MSSDLQLRQDVLDELEFEPSVNAAHIGVTANHSVVTLTGFVTSYAEKTMAERAARRVKGVKAIAEEIEVRLPSDLKRADDEIAARAVDILKWQVGLPADRIRVKVEKGVVTLTGEAKLQQALVSGSVDVGLAGGSSMVFALNALAAPEAAPQKGKKGGAGSAHVAAPAKGRGAAMRGGGATHVRTAPARTQRSMA